MTRPLRALLVEDSANDAELVVLELERHGFAVTHLRVETAAAMRAALDDGAFDVVLCDNALPHFNAIEGLAVLKASDRDLPFIIVSGSIGDDIAVACMRAGAHDYLMKNSMARLGPAVERELAEAANRRERRCYKEERGRHYEREKATHAEVERLYEEANRAKEDLAQKQTELTTILDASPALIWYKNRDNEILRVNKPAAESIGRATEELEGRSMYELYPEEDAKKYHLDDLEVINSGRPKLDIIEPYRIASGETRWVRTDRIPYRDGQGNIIGVIVFALDITEHKQAEEALERIIVQERHARLDAERLSRVKDEFLITLSHELRTPLVPILGWIDMLINSSLDQKSALEALKTIERNAKSELQLIEDLLEISRIITGKLTIEGGSVTLLQIVKDATQTLRLAAEAKHLDLRLEVDQDPGVVAGDARRLQQVVWNLLGNAIKFTGKGGRIIVRVARKESLAIIAVTDTGIGIKPDFLPHVFERFRQADSSTTRTFGGLGLGLALVRHITEAHGGTVTAESPGEEQGATFTVSLPIAAIRLQPASKIAKGENTDGTNRDPNGPPVAQPLRLAGVKVLVVDDMPDDRSLLITLLMRHGADVIAVGSAREALEAVVSWQPHVLVSDVGMPNEDGISLMRRVRGLSDQCHGVPAIALTAYGSADDRRRVLDAGFQLHLAKPAESAKLVDAIANLAASSHDASIELGNLPGAGAAAHCATTAIQRAQSPHPQRPMS